MRQNEPGFLPGYGCALISVLLATGVRLLLQPSLSEHQPFATFYLAVALTAWFAGVWPSVVALILGAFLAFYFILPPAGEWAITSAEQALGLGVYLIVGLGLSLFSESLRIARRQAAEHAEAARDRQQALEQEMRERERTEAALRASEQALIESNQRKDEFLAMLGHELRTPLSATSTTLHLLRQRVCGDEKLESLIDRSERQTRRMGRLIDDLQDVARISRGKMLIRFEPVELVSLLRQVGEDQRPLLEETGLKLHLALPGPPLLVYGDPTRLTQVVVNLLSNALKFTDPGGEVTVHLAGDRDWATLTVRDTGIGIDPSLQDRIFQQFAQVERSLERSRGGLGLGLALVKGVVELHGGDCRIESAGLGHGTSVICRLPRLAQEQPATSTNQEER